MKACAACIFHAAQLATLGHAAQGVLPAKLHSPRDSALRERDTAIGAVQILLNHATNARHRDPVPLARVGCTGRGWGEKKRSMKKEDRLHGCLQKCLRNARRCKETRTRLGGRDCRGENRAACSSYPQTARAGHTGKSWAVNKESS